MNESLETMRKGSGGNDRANAVEAWEAGLDELERVPDEDREEVLV